jgi:glycosyltransferase involved in cell wall biosynthesis
MQSNKLKTIYIFTDWYVPGYKAGGPIQSVYNLAMLLSRNLTVKIITRNMDYGSVLPYESIVPNHWTRLSENHEVMYLSDENVKYGIIKEMCREASDHIILINGLFSFYFSILPLFFTNYYSAKKVFLSVRGMLHQSALSVKPLKKQVYLAFARGFGLFKKATLLATSQYESEEIKSSLGKVKIRIAPNIPMQPLTGEATLTKDFRDKDGHLRLLFLGRISPEKNPVKVLEALKEIKYPVSITFIGSSIDKNYQNIFETAMYTLPGNIKIEWVRELPHHQLEEVFRKTDVMILPSHGENFGHAIFESFAQATPVIIGNNTPWKGLEAEAAGIEVDPNDTSSVLMAINRFNNMEIIEYQQFQIGALNKANAYFANNNFEQLYASLFA